MKEAIFKNGKIIQGDCLQYMKNMKDESVDLIVTSPPYNIGKEYEKIMPLQEYVQWCETWLNELFRVSKPNGILWLNLGYVSVDNKGKAIPLPYILWDKIPFYIMQEIVWHYGAGVACKNSFSPRNEKWLFCVKNKNKYTFHLDKVRVPTKYPNQKKNGKLKCNPNGKNPSDVWDIPKVTSGKNRSSKEREKHPAQFPEAIINRILKCCSNENDVVFDPFLGSGTTCAVANKLNRNFIGIELRDSYFDIAKERLNSDS